MNTPKLLKYTDAVGYIRVSGKEQAEEGLSLDMQITKIKAYAAFRGLNLVGIYGDPAKSAWKRNMPRPGFETVCHLAREQRIQHVVIYMLDRFARRTRELLAKIEDDFEPNNVALHSCCEQFDLSSPYGIMIITVLSAAAQMDSSLKSERIRHTMVEAREQGRRTARYAKVGYRVVPGRKELAADPREKRAIELARDLRNSGLSLRAISSKLKKRGYVARSGNPYPPSTINKMIKEDRV